MKTDEVEFRPQAGLILARFICITNLMFLVRWFKKIPVFEIKENGTRRQIRLGEILNDR